MCTTTNIAAMRLLGPICCILLAVLCTACGLPQAAGMDARHNAPAQAAPHVELPRYVLTTVPFAKQAEGDCGPSALWMATGGRHDLSALRKTLYRPELGGTTTLDMLLAARALGHTARIVHSDPHTARDSLTTFRPFIALVDNGYGPVRLRHFVVVLGGYHGGVVLHDGTRAYTTENWDTFTARWQRTNYTALLIDEPPA